MKESLFSVENMEQILSLMKNFISVSELAIKLKCTERTIYRKLDALEEYGFVFERKLRNQRKYYRVYYIPEDFSNQVIKLAGLVQRQSIG